MGRLAGYEYSYSFCADDDSIISKYPWLLFALRREGKKTYLFEIRTSFKLRGKDGQITELGCERFGCVSWEDNVSFLVMETMFRLKDDYWMSVDEHRSWALAALDFAKQTELAGSSSSEQRVIAVVVELDVLTVQQEGEPIEAAKERAIKPESLIPIFLWVVGPFPHKRRDMDIDIASSHIMFLTVLPRIRVEDEAVMALTCAVCSRNWGAKGTQISFLPNCDHPVHPRCLFELLWEQNSSCPSCSAPIPDDEQIDDWEQLAASTPPIIPTQH